MRRPLLLLVVTAALVGGCGAGDEAPPAPPTAGSTAPSSAVSPSPTGAEYRPGRGVTVDLPASPPDAVVVLVPGGGWSVADPAQLAPLAAELTANGFAVVTITYGTSSTEALYPLPPADVACAAAYAAEQVPDVPVVLVGHSAGAHLSALVGLVPEREDDGCPSPPHAPDGVVGLAGVYDIAAAPGLARNLFGTHPSEDPASWSDGNPMTWVGERPDVPFLLLHGTSDTVVPDSFTEVFAQALTDGGHPVTVELVPDVDHMQVIEPAVAASRTTDWIRSVVLAP